MDPLVPTEILPGQKTLFDEFFHDGCRGRDIEVLIYTPEELDRISHRKFIQRAWQEGKVIYES